VLPYRKKATEGKRRGNGLRLRLGEKEKMGCWALSLLLSFSSLLFLQNYFREKHEKALRIFAT
jgi:hypothetical protein